VVKCDVLDDGLENPDRETEMTHAGPFILAHDRARSLAIQAIQEAPEGWKVTIEAPKRSDAANRAIQPLIREWAEKVEPVLVNGVQTRLHMDDWRHILVARFRREEPRYVLLDGILFLLGVSSKELTSKEGSEFIEFIHAAAAERGFRLTAIEPEPVR
jgi:NinB protein